MAVKIRLRRTGKKKEVHYRVVVAEATTAREGSFIETLGYVNPRVHPAQVKIDEAKARLWLERGAQPTDTVRDILRRQGILAAPEVATPAAEQPAETGAPTPEVAAESETPVAEQAIEITPPPEE